MFIEKPISFDMNEDIRSQKTRICRYLMETITEKGRSLPLHRVVPYPNIPKKDYPMNKSEE